LFVWVPVALWLGYEDRMGWAIFTAAWGLLVVGTVDNFLRPYFISHGSQLPLLLIFAGVLGGLLAWGLIGIFLGATLLAVGYTLLHDWLYQDFPAMEALSKEG
jgi:predicted PurR-regulated permease PerM